MGRSYPTGCRRESVTIASLFGEERLGRAGASSSRLRLARSASSSCRRPASGSTSEHRSCVPGVQKMRPLKPCATSRGSMPKWSRWAWVSTTASIDRRRHRRIGPVAQPQFLQSLEHAAVDEHAPSGRLHQIARPVTVRAAPRNVSVDDMAARTLPDMRRAASRPRGHSSGLLSYELRRPGPRRLFRGALHASRSRIVLAALTAAASTALAQTPRALTIDDLYDPQKRIDVSGGAPAGLTWVSDTHYVWPRPEAGGVEWTMVEAATGASTPLFEAKAVSDRAAEAVGLDSAVDRPGADQPQPRDERRAHGGGRRPSTTTSTTSRSAPTTASSGSPPRPKPRRSSPSAPTANSSASCAATTSTSSTSITGANAGSPPTAARSC